MAQVAAPRTSLGTTRRSALQDELDQVLQGRRSRGLTTGMTTSDDSDSSDAGLGSDDDFLSQFTSTFKKPDHGKDQSKWQPPTQRASGKSTPTFDVRGKHTPTRDLKEQDGRKSASPRDSPFGGKYLKKNQSRESPAGVEQSGRHSVDKDHLRKSPVDQSRGEHDRTSPSRVSPFPTERSLKSPSRVSPLKEDSEARKSPFEGRQQVKHSPRDSPFEDKYRRKSPGRDDIEEGLTYRKSPTRESHVEGVNRRKSPSRDLTGEGEHLKKGSPRSSPYQRRRDWKNARGDSTLEEDIHRKRSGRREDPEKLSERASPSERARYKKSSFDLDSEDMNEETPKKREASFLDFLEEPRPSPKPRKDRSGAKKREGESPRPKPTPRSRTISENSQEGYRDSPSNRASLRRSPTKEHDRRSPTKEHDHRSPTKEHDRRSPTKEQDWDLRPTPSPRGRAATDRRRLFKDSKGTGLGEDLERRSETPKAKSRETSPSLRHKSGQKSPSLSKERSRGSSPRKRMDSGSSEDELDQFLKHKDRRRQHAKDSLDNSDSDSIPDIDVKVKHKKGRKSDHAVLPTPPPRKSPFRSASQDKGKAEKEEKERLKKDWEEKERLQKEWESDEETISQDHPDPTPPKQRLHKEIADAVLADVAQTNKPRSKKEEDREDETQHTMQYIQPDSTSRRPQSAGSERREAGPTLKPVPKRPSSAGAQSRKPPEPPNLEDSASIRLAIYQDWLSKKTDLSKEKIKKKLSERQKEQQQKEKESLEKKKDAELSYRAWKEKKDSHLKGKLKQKKKDEEKKKEEEEEEQVKKLQAKKMFESWKSTKDDYLRKKWREAKREEEEKKRKEREKQKERQEDSKKLFETWTKRKEDSIMEVQRDERRKAREEKRQKQKEQEEREMRCQDEYEEFLDRKERQRKEDLQRRRVRSMENLSQKAWSPASRTIPVGR